jgi:hypothetical protein
VRGLTSMTGILGSLALVWLLFTRMIMIVRLSVTDQFMIFLPW